MSSALVEPSLGSKPPLVAAADPFGEALKDSLVAHLRQKGYTVDDSGTSAYYDAAAAVAKRVQADGSVRGLLFCGTGMGVGMIANKFSGVRAATCENVPAARCSRAINDANVLCLGGKVTSPADANDIADAWLAQEHAKAPGDYEWWSADVEAFLGSKWPAIRKVEEDSREH